MKKILNYLSILLLIFCGLSCSSDDDQPNTSTLLTRQQLQGTWKVTYFKNQVEKTSDYSGYLFTFDLNDAIDVDANGSPSSGVYDLYENQIANEKLTIIDAEFSQTSTSVTVNDRLRELTEQWIVRKVTNNASQIEVEELISNNPPEVLHLTKI